MARLLRLIRPLAGWMALAVGLGAATIASSVALMATSAYLISVAALHPSIADLNVAIVGVRFFGLSRGVSRYAERLISHTATLRLLSALRVWFYQAVEPLAPARLVDARSGDLASRAVADVDALQDFYVRVLAPAGVAVLIAIGTAAFVGSFDAILAGILLASFGVAGLALPLFIQRLSHRPAAALAAARGELNAEIVDALQGLADLAALGAREDFLRRLRQRDASLAVLQRRTTWIQAAQMAACSGLAHLAMATVLAVAVRLVSTGRLDGVMLGALALGTLAAFEAVTPLPAAAQALESSRAAAERLFEMADSPPPVPDPVRAAPAPEADVGVALEVRRLRFRYASDLAPALDGVDFRLASGGRLALVGPSGAGKSTLASLILRLWDHTEGEIRLGGVDIRQMTGEAVRQRIAVVSQVTHLFNASLRENLLLARPTATAADLDRVLRLAQLDTFVETLASGLETAIGERGLTLSAGQRQRVSIARALLRDAPFLLLDEPTSDLDPITERSLLAALQAAWDGRTVLWITHRLVGLEAMDEILVLAHGRVVERGVHAKLSHAGGLYQRMLELQNQAWDVLEEAGADTPGRPKDQNEVAARSRQERR